MRNTVIIAIMLIGFTLAGCQPAASTPTPQPTTPTQTVPPPVSTPPPPPPTIPVGVSIGNLAPDFTLQTLAGDNITLSGLRGKAVVLNFWATWCGPCRAEMPLLQQIHDGWKDKGLILLAIDLIGSTRTETPEAVTKFMNDLSLSMTVPLDNGLKTAKVYSITAIPTTFMIDKDGVIRYKKIGAFANKTEIETALPLIIP